MVTVEHIGKTVTDGVREGVLMDVYEDVDETKLPPYRKPQLVAWVRPEGGGIEWDARPSALFTVTEWESTSDVEQPS